MVVTNNRPLIFSKFTPVVFGWYFGQIRVNPTDDNLKSVVAWRRLFYCLRIQGSLLAKLLPDWQTYEVQPIKHRTVVFLLAKIKYYLQAGWWAFTKGL